MRKSFTLFLLLFLLPAVFNCSGNNRFNVSEKNWIETQLNIEALYFNSLSFPYKVRINSVAIDENDNVVYELIYSSDDLKKLEGGNLEGTITRDIDIFNKFINTTVQKYGVEYQTEFDYQVDIICRVQTWDTAEQTHKDIAVLENGLFRMLR